MNLARKIFLTIVVVTFCASVKGFRRKDFMERCPLVKSMRNFQLEKMMGYWNIVQYYSSTEETAEYKCMRSDLEITDAKEITMNITYAYIYDEDKDSLNGNITWKIVNFADSSHWRHAEEDYEGVYNTYVIDTDYENWALIMHCAEKKKYPRYLSALMMSRTLGLGTNVKVFLREKLPKYNIDLDYMFEVRQDNCDQLAGSMNMKDYYENVLKNKESNEVEFVGNLN